MKLEVLEDQMMAMAAHRYCLGRRSYIVGACLDWLRATWTQLQRNSQHVILRDTVEALIDDRAGGDFYVRRWTEAAQWMYAQMDTDQRSAVLDSLAWKNAGPVIDALLT